MMMMSVMSALVNNFCFFFFGWATHVAYGVSFYHLYKMFYDVFFVVIELLTI